MYAIYYCRFNIFGDRGQSRVETGFNDIDQAITMLESNAFTIKPVGSDPHPDWAKAMPGNDRVIAYIVKCFDINDQPQPNSLY